MEEKKLAKIRKSNMKLYPIYKMVGLDWIFYYGIKVLFLTRSKKYISCRRSIIWVVLCILLYIVSDTKYSNNRKDRKKKFSCFGTIIKLNFYDNHIILP